VTALPDRAPLSATVPGPGTARSGKGPLGALPALSAAARRALILTAILSVLDAAALVAQAFLLAGVLAGIVAGRATAIGPALAAVLGAVLARALLALAIRTVAARAAAGAKEELRASAVDHALRLGPEWIARRGPGELTALTTRGLDALDAYFTDYLPAMVTAAVVPLAAGVAILVADRPSAVIIALTVPLLPLFGILVGKYTADRVGAATDAVHRLSGHLLEMIRALPVLAAFRRAQAQAEVVQRVSDRHRKATLATLRVAFSSAFVLELAATLSVALVAVAIGVRLVSGELSLVIGLGVLILAPECFQPLRSVGAAFHASEDGVEAVRRVAEIVDEPVPADGVAVPGRGEVRVGGLRVRRRDGFAPDGESFVARPGEIVWLRSPSGAGKSTTLAALLGFVAPSAGTVTVDGTPLHQVDLSRWRRSIAWVPQHPAFAGGTVRTELELALADLPGGAAQEETAALLGALELRDLADEPVASLSTGQRQRVALARALLRTRHGAWLLLLDEPTAHLDAANATRVMVAVGDAARAGAAVVIAAHERPTMDVAQPCSEPEHPATVAETTPPRARLPLRFLLDRQLATGIALGAAALVCGLALTATSGWLIAKASQQPPILTLTVAVVGVRAFGLGRAVLRYGERLATHDAAFRIASRLRVRLWEALVRIGPAHTLGLRRGEGQRRLVQDVDTVRDLVPRVVAAPAIGAIVLVVAVAVQAWVLPAAGLALALTLLVGACMAPPLAVLAERRATTALAAGRREVAASVLGLFDAAAELIAFGAHRTRCADLADADARLVRAGRRQALGAGAADAVVILTTGFGAVVGTWLAGGAVAAGALDPVLAPVLALVPLALAEVLAALPAAAQHRDTLRAARGRIADLLGRPPCPDRVPGGGRDIAWAGVQLRWPGAAAPALRGVDLRIPAGSYVAVTGPSGAGKSTLVAGLLGFLRPERGRATGPTRVAWAPQEPQLVSTTVEENLRLADPHASRDRLTQALRLAGLPGLDLGTVLGSAGAGLSGGQAGRLALARALVAAPHSDLVLLDEPTAHLDETTARAVRSSLRRELAGRTVVHVTHHPAEVAGADVVLDVSGGRVTSRVRASPATAAAAAP
jgi:thiol reductant ABC exporter CydD subunit/thiol reductant ABC exporter CydC subunit